MILDQLSVLEKQSLLRGIPILGREKGEWLLKQIIKHKPQKILELGTANGYSGCILGSQGGELITVEIDEKIAEEAAVNFSKYNINAEIVLGDGISIIKDFVKQGLSFDLILIDFCKKGYLQVLSSCLSLIKTGGVIIADNITMDGCLDFKEAVLNHPRLKTEIINIKDSLSYSVKV